jgi:hypothetical protein
LSIAINAAEVTSYLRTAHATPYRLLGYYVSSNGTALSHPLDLLPFPATYYALDLVQTDGRLEWKAEQVHRATQTRSALKLKYGTSAQIADRVTQMKRTGTPVRRHLSLRSRSQPLRWRSPRANQIGQFPRSRLHQGGSSGSPAGSDPSSPASRSGMHGLMRRHGRCVPSAGQRVLVVKRGIQNQAGRRSRHRHLGPRRRVLRTAGDPAPVLPRLRVASRRPWRPPHARSRGPFPRSCRRRDR